MTTNDVAMVLDMVSGKAGDLVSRMQPLAVEVVHQYRMRGLVRELSGIVALISAYVFGYILVRSVSVFLREVKKEDLDIAPAVGSSAGIVLAGIFFVVFLIFGLENMLDGLSQYVAPLCGLLGK